jgi:hypothetical protein
MLHFLHLLTTALRSLCLVAGPECVAALYNSVDLKCYGKPAPLATIHVGDDAVGLVIVA